MIDLRIGDANQLIRAIPDNSLHCCISSPPYYQLRDYGTAAWDGGDPACDHVVQRYRIGDGLADFSSELKGGGERAQATPAMQASDICPKCSAKRIDAQMGLEASPDAYIASMVALYREIRRALRPDGTCWINIGDSYSSMGGDHSVQEVNQAGVGGARAHHGGAGDKGQRRPPPNLKTKDLMGIPWRLAFALQQPFYTGNIKSEKDRIWLAAMLDGEGCIFLHKRKVGQNNGGGYKRKNDVFACGIEIANTNRAIIDKCMAIAGAGSICEQSKGRRQTIYRWNARSNQARDILIELYPDLVAKQHQARLAIGCPQTGNDAEKSHQGLMDLHNGIECQFDFKAPDTLYEPGCYLRQDIVWAKPNPMPESVKDRATKSHEYLFLLSKSPSYYFDQDAWAEARVGDEDANGFRGGSYCHDALDNDSLGKREAVGNKRHRQPAGWQQGPGAHDPFHPDGRARDVVMVDDNQLRRNKRSVWTIASRALDLEMCRSCQAIYGKGEYRALARINIGADDAPKWRRQCRCGANDDWLSHFATYPPDLIEPAILAGCPKDGTILDPFGGAGTTGLVADRLQRNSILFELNPAYAAMAQYRIDQDRGGLLGLMESTA